MVREVSIRTVIESCTARKFFSVLLETPSPLERFHKMVNKDNSPQVRPWQGGCRDVAFCLPVDLPNWLKSIVGVTRINVNERQTLVWEQQGQFVVTSEPVLLGVPLGSKIRTKLILTVTDLGEEGCEVEWAALCSASVGWPMSAAMESVMAQDAKSSLVVQLDFYKNILFEHDKHIPIEEHYPETHMRPRSRLTLNLDDRNPSLSIDSFYDALEIIESEVASHESLQEVIVDGDDLQEPLICRSAISVGSRDAAEEHVMNLSRTLSRMESLLDAVKIQTSHSCYHLLTCINTVLLLAILIIVCIFVIKGGR